ncbi:MAG TPA: thioredoxin [Thermoanaerobaculia bacterium]
MSQGVVRSCPSCGRKNRLLFDRLGEKARCGACESGLPALAEPVALDDGTALTAAIREASLPVLVDFWAPWCGPCRHVAPEIAKVAERQAGRLLVVKVNTDVDQRVSTEHRIQSIPTMALFQGGRELERTSGARPAAAIESFVEHALRQR